MGGVDLAPAADEVTQLDRWFLRPRPRRRAAVRLICAPYAGGGAAAFHGWAEALGSAVEVWVLRLPGRDARMREAPRRDLHGLVRDAVTACGPHLTEPFALFGHSLGASIAFEMAHQLRDRFGVHADHLFVSSRVAPHLAVGYGRLHELPDDSFLDAIDQRFQAIPPLIRDDPDLRRLYLPTLRADTEMLETYEHEPSEPLTCPITALGGVADPEVHPDDLAAWGRHGQGDFAVVTFPGGHFYLQEQRPALLARVAQEMISGLVP